MTIHSIINQTLSNARFVCDVYACSFFQLNKKRVCVFIFFQFSCRNLFPIRVLSSPFRIIYSLDSFFPNFRIKLIEEKSSLRISQIDMTYFTPKSEEEYKVYLDNLLVEYQFACFSEKLGDGTF